MLTLFLGVVIVTCVNVHSTAQQRPLRITQPDVQLTITMKGTLVGHKDQVLRLAFSPNGEFLASSSYEENATRLWNTTTGQLIGTIDGTAPAFSPDNRVLITVDKKTVKLWDAVTGKLKFTLTGHDGLITSAAFSRDSSKLATGSEDGTVKLWDVATGQPSATLVVWRVKKIARFRIISRALHVPIDVYVKFSPNQQTVLTSIYWEESPAKLWDASAGKLQAELGGHTTMNSFYQPQVAGVVEASFSPNGKFIATQSYGELRLWETATGKLIKEFKIPFPVTAFSPDSRWLGLIENGSLGFLNLETMQVQPVVGDVDLGFLNQLAFSSDSKTCVLGSGYKNYHATLIDLPTGQVRATIPLVAKWGFDFISDYQKDSDGLSFHPSSRFLMGSNHGSIRLWDVSNGAVVWSTIEAREPAVFSADGRLLATVGKDKKSVLLWNVTTN